MPDVFPVVFNETAAVPMPLSAGPHVDIRRETAPAVVPLAEEMTLRVATVGLSDDGSDCPAELLNFESDCCFMDGGVLVRERSPVVSARGAAVPTSLKMDSDGAAVVCTTLLDEAVDNTLEVVGWHDGQLWFRTNPEDALPVMPDEHSLMSDLVWPDVIPVHQNFVLNDVCGDDRFSPGVTECATVNRQTGLDSHGEVLWEGLSVRKFMWHVGRIGGCVHGLGDPKSVCRWLFGDFLPF